jgi:hypothetical protein
MTISLNKSRKPSGGGSGDRPEGAAVRAPAPASRSPQPRQQKPEAETYGRSCAPPPPGSSYWEFLHWSTEGGMPFPEDVDLAISLWMGCPPTAEEPSPPGPR